MIDRNETHAEVVKQMRVDGVIASRDGTVTMGGNALLEFADRAEAAHKREVDKLNAVIQAQRSQFDAEIDRLRREKSPGNAAKMREALAELVEHLEEESRLHDDTAGNIAAFLLNKFKLREALSAPPHEAKWTANGGYEFACCSSCGHLQYAGWDSRAEQAEKIGDFHELYKFCPNCGAQMKGETDGSK